MFPKLLIAITLLSVSVAAAQDPPRVCKRSALAASKPIPKLRYSCRGVKDDEKILKLPARVQAIRVLMAQLTAFSDAAWWKTPVDDLNVCDFRKKAGTLTSEEDEQFSTNFTIKLFGSDHIRLVLLPDPCYQTEYSGSVGFILNYSGGRTYVAKSLDGFFTRADNAVNIDFAKLDRDEIIEISTGSGGLHPEITNYYFTVDAKTKRAIPKALFEGDKGPTNQITSALLMSDPEDLGLPKGAETLKIIDGGSLAKSFSVYNEVFEGGKIDDNGRMLNRIVLTWNGQVYK
jgi:hypothetical protein